MARQHSNSSIFTVFILVLAGVLFVLYPALRPFSDEASLQGAAAFGSDAWLISHTFAIIAFILLALAHARLSSGPDAGIGARLGEWIVAVYWIGVGLLLPFYGAETFGLHPIGEAAVVAQDEALMGLADAVRSGAGLLLFLAGLLLIAVASVLVAVALWKSSQFPRWSGIPLAVGICLYTPQFFWDQPMRVAHGVLVAAGCFCVAYALWQRRE